MSTKLQKNLQPLGVTKIPLKGNKKTGLEDGSRQPESKPENKVRKKEVKHFFILNKAFFDILVQEKSCRTKKVHGSWFNNPVVAKSYSRKKGEP